MYVKKKIAMIPVREGSKRLTRKNYIEIGGVPIFERQIRKAIESNCFDRIVLNSEDKSLKTVATALGIDFYLRDKDLANDTATSDQVVLDFFENFIKQEDIFLCWLNTASPLTTLSDIVSFCSMIDTSGCPSIVTVRQSIGHILYDGAPLNFTLDGGFAQTQSLKPVFEFNYALMGWAPECVEDLANGTLFGNGSQYFLSSFFSNILLKRREDLELIDSLVSKGMCS